MLVAWVCQESPDDRGPSVFVFHCEALMDAKAFDQLYSTTTPASCPRAGWRDWQREFVTWQSSWTMKSGHTILRTWEDAPLTSHETLPRASRLSEVLQESFCCFQEILFPGSFQGFLKLGRHMCLLRKRATWATCTADCKGIVEHLDVISMIFLEIFGIIATSGQSFGLSQKWFSSTNSCCWTCNSPLEQKKPVDTPSESAFEKNSCLAFDTSLLFMPRQT